MFRTSLCILFFYNLLICKAHINYCVVDGNATGITIDDGKGKDSSMNSIPSTFSDNSTLKIYFDNNFEACSNFQLVSSIADKQIDQLIFDKRWETFLNDHDDPVEIQNLLRSNADFYLSVQINQKWLYFKKVGHELFFCDRKKCDRKIDGTTAWEYYLNNSGSNRFWKIHDYKYFYTDKESTNELSFKSPEICEAISKGCLSSYFVLCANCTITLNLHSRNTKETLQFSTIGSGNWSTEQFNLNSFNTCFNITVTTRTVNDTQAKFWAIGEIGYLSQNSSCEENKRYIEVDTLREPNITCKSATNEEINMMKELPHLTMYRLSNQTSDINLVEKQSDYTLSINCQNATNQQYDNTKQIINTSTTPMILDETILEPTSQKTEIAISVLIIVIILVLTVIIVVVFICCILNRKRSYKNIEKAHTFESFTINTTMEEKTSLIQKNYRETVRGNEESWTTRKLSLYENLKGGWSIKKNYFAQYVEEAIGNRSNILRNQLLSISSNTKTHQEGSNIVNMHKNCSYNISMRFIQGSTSSKEYIVTENPVQNTLENFWLMIWEENVADIVISGSCDGFEKYWPAANEVMICFNEIKIILVKESYDNQYYIQRKLMIKRKNEEKTRMVTQLHYHTWKDDPNLSSLVFIDFVNRLLEIPHYSAPVLFHSRNGINGCGTMILCDITLRTALLTDTIDLYSISKELRQTGTNVVSTLEQYELAHLIIKYVLTQ